MSTQIKLKNVKQGEFFRLKDSETAPVWVRDEYCREEKKFSVHKYDDFCHSSLKKGDTMVFVGFTF